MNLDEHHVYSGDPPLIGGAKSYPGHLADRDPSAGGQAAPQAARVTCR
jgi:hypothetical protein